MSNAWDEYQEQDQYGTVDGWDNETWEEETPWVGQDEDDFSQLCYRRSSLQNQSEFPDVSAQELLPRTRRGWSAMDDQQIPQEDYHEFTSVSIMRRQQPVIPRQAPSSFQRGRFHPYRGSNRGSNRGTNRDRNNESQFMLAMARRQQARAPKQQAANSNFVRKNTAMNTMAGAYHNQPGTSKGPGPSPDNVKGIKARALLHSLRQLPPRPQPEERPAHFPALMRVRATQLRGAVWQRDAKTQTTPTLCTVETNTDPNDSTDGTDGTNATVTDENNVQTDAQTPPKPPMQLHEIIQACLKARQDLVTLASGATESEKQELAKGFLLLQGSFMQWLEAQ